jgi:hypothetical protein
MSDEKTTWTTAELQKDFEVLSFGAPFVSVKNKETGEMGTLQFDDHPRIYSNFVKDE